MKSIKKISEIHYYIFLVTLLFILFLFLYTLFSSITIPIMNKKFRVTVQHLTELICSLDVEKYYNGTSVLNIETIYSKYIVVENDLTLMDKNLKAEISFPKVFSHQPITIMENLPEFRLCLAKLNENFSNELTRSNNIKIILISLTLLLSFIQLLQISSWKKNQEKFIKEVNNGVLLIQKTLQHKLSSPIIHPEDMFEEIDSIKRLLTKIENEIFFDREILDINIQGDLDVTMEELYNIISKEMECDRIILSFLNKNNILVAESTYASYDNVLLKDGYSENLQNASLLSLKDSTEPRILKDLDSYIIIEPTSVAINLIYKEGIRSMIIFPILFRDKCVGFLFVASVNKNVYFKEQLAFGKRVMSLLKHKFYNEYVLKDIISQTSNSFVKLMDLKDNETANHIKRMSHYSYIIANKYMDKYKGLTPKVIRDIFWFSPLHDIGKVGIPDSVLLKPGKLNSKEWDVMKTHVTLGEDVLEDMNNNLSSYFSLPPMRTAVDIIQGHHERYDGSGYPRGLKGDNIPLAGRIVSLADVFDALTTNRPYKNSFSIDETLDILEKDMKGYFDPKVYNCFIESLDKILVVYNKYKED